MKKPPYLYVFVRKDLSIQDQMCQACHAAQISGAEYGCPEDCHIVVLQVTNEEELLVTSLICNKAKIKYIIFDEQCNGDDENLGFTAISTEPITQVKRQYFSKYKLWSH